MALIEMRNLSKSYRMGRSNQVLALSDVNLTIERGETVSIVGKSGSGKSTLLNILGALDAPTSGTYRIDGRDIPWNSDRELARLRNRRIGFVFQEFALIPGQKAWENVALPLIHGGLSFRESKTKAVAALEELGLGEYVEHRVEELSGGQRQRVAIARAVVNNPDIILADEPTGALDQATGQQVMRSLLHLQTRGCTLVVVTHDMDIARSCGRVIEIVDGKVVNLCKSE
jgi:ABC-type lipoprotein export system ATPase subunit